VSLWRPAAAFRRCAGEALVAAKGLASPAIKAPNAWHIGVDLKKGQRYEVARPSMTRDWAELRAKRRIKARSSH
jgi:hypothetical protein